MTGSMPLFMLILWPLAGAFTGYFLGRGHKEWRDICSVLVSLGELILALWVFAGVSRGAPDWFSWPGFCGFGLRLRLDGLRGVYCVITSLLWLAATVFSREYFQRYRNRNRYHFFTLLTLAFTVGVFLAPDLFTAFVFFELMSFSSFVMIISNERPASLEAGRLYIFVALACGLMLLFGIQKLESITGTLDFGALFEICGAMPDKRPLLLPGILMLAGFGAKAGMFPLHITLPEAYPAAPAPAAALLSGVLSKNGVLGILAISTNLFYHDGSWGLLILVLGLITMVLGAVMGLFTMELKRLLAWSSVSQIGFILLGAGMQGLLGEHNALAVRGTFLHMINHSLIKLVFFLAAGTAGIRVLDLNLNKIRGFGRGKPVLHLSFLAAALSIAGVPLFSGYISKTLLHESIVEYIRALEAAGQNPLFYQAAEWIFILTGGFTAAYILKIYFAVFWEKNRERQKEFDALGRNYLWKGSKPALAVPAAVLPVLGFFPYQTMDRLANLGQSFMHGHSPEHAVRYFAWVNLKGSLYSLAVGVLVYAVFVRGVLRDREGAYTSRWPEKLDLNRAVYRPLFLTVFPAIGRLFARASYLLAERGFDVLLAAVLADQAGKLPSMGFGGTLAFLLTAGLAVGRLLYGIVQKGFSDAVTQGNGLIHKLFSFTDRLDGLLHSAMERRADRHEEFAFGTVPKERKEEHEAWKGINNSLSYSLLLFGLGLLAAMIFLLLRW